MAQELKIGDVVQLKSGGPLMTVRKVDVNFDNEPFISCVWFDDKKECNGDYHSDTVAIYREETYD